MSLLLNYLLHPTPLSNPEWNELLRQARHHGLMGRLARLAPSPPPRVARHLQAALREAGQTRQRLLWEVERIRHILLPAGITIIPLKGASYALADLPLAQGRVSVDLDLLVPQSQLRETEGILLAKGWESLKENPYDQDYYRRWMHELPPLRHRQRGTVLDLHHALLPPTHRYAFDPAPLFSDAQPHQEGVRLLAPRDRLLHAVVHLFADGDFRFGLKELLDISELLDYFSPADESLPTLQQRARQFGLLTPLRQALTARSRLFRQPPPTSPTPTDHLIHTLLQANPAHPTLAQQGAAWLLYLRSHWLRMPPTLLLPHLAKKGWRRLTNKFFNG